MVASLNFAPARNGNTAPYGTIQWSQARIVTQFSSQVASKPWLYTFMLPQDSYEYSSKLRPDYVYDLTFGVAHT